MGIRLLGVDVNESGWKYAGRECTIRMGFKQLRQIPRNTLETMLSEREKNGPFTSMEDFLWRVPLSFSEAAILVKSGAMDSISKGLNRPQILWMTALRLQNAASSRRCTQSGRMRFMFSSGKRFPPPPLPDLTVEQKWRQELDAVGFLFTVHPLQTIMPMLQKGPKVSAAKDLARLVGKRVWVLGWPITRKEVMTKDGDSMEFISFEDETAIYETVFFPKAFRSFCQGLDMGKAFLLYGQVECEYGAESLVIHRLRRIEVSRSP
jgi:DNA polymerase III alpha subunit